MVEIGQCVTMNAPGCSRNQRPKPFKVKQVVQFAFLFGICIWLLYQIRHSHHRERVDIKITREKGVLSFGRKESIIIRKGPESLNNDNETRAGDNEDRLEGAEAGGRKAVLQDENHNLTAPGQQHDIAGDKVHIFHDENGISQEDRDSVKFNGTLLNDAQKIIHQEATSLDGVVAE